MIMLHTSSLVWKPNSFGPANPFSMLLKCCSLSVISSLREKNLTSNDLFFFKSVDSLQTAIISVNLAVRTTRRFFRWRLRSCSPDKNNGAYTNYRFASAFVNPNTICLFREFAESSGVSFWIETEHLAMFVTWNRSIHNVHFILGWVEASDKNIRSPALGNWASFVVTVSPACSAML